MTAPSYTEDLTDIATGDEIAGWVEMTGTDGNGEDWDEQGLPAYQDNEYPYIQGSYAVTQDCTKSTAVGSLGYNAGGITVPTDGAVFVWHNFSSPFAFGTYAQGGYMIALGSGLSDFDIWYTGGRDKGRMPYGGFENHVVNPTVTPDDTAGSSTGTINYVASGVYVVSGPSKGEPHQVDVMRYGRGSAIFEYGEEGDYCTIDGFAAANDDQGNRWGLIQAIPGGYLWKGRMQLGSGSNPVAFVDSNKIIFVDWTPKVTANFNTVEILNASSSISMTGFQFICLDPSTTASKGRWITTNDATVVLTSCLFQDMSTFTFDSNTTATSCTWKRCAQIDPGGGDISFASILESTVTGGGSAGGGALLWNDSADPNSYINDTTITKGAGSHHAIEFGTSAPTTINLTNMTVSGFNASNQQADSALYFPDTGSDVTWNVAHTGTSGTLSYYKARGGDTVNITSSVSLEITVKDVDGNLLDDVQTAIYKTSDRTQLMNEDTVDGVASENYTGATPVEVEVRCRKASSGATRYKNYSSIQNVTGNFKLTVTMVEDPNNNATT